MMDVCDTPQDLPDLVLDIIFSDLTLSDLFSCMLVCRNWNRAINCRRAKPWKSICLREVPKELLNLKHLSQLNSYKAKIRALHNSWNPNDCSMNIVILQNGFSFTRKQVGQSTDMVRTKFGYDTGKHVWEFTWNRPIGSVAMIGLSTRRTPLQCEGYKPLLGSTENSWGWNIVDNVLLHKSIPHGCYPLLKKAPKYKMGEKIQLVLDADNGTLSFEINNIFLGIAFNDLPKIKLYPSVSVVYGNTNVSVVYIGKLLH